MARVLLEMGWVALVLLVPYSLGQTVMNFKLDLTWGTAAPDGIERRMILTNGQFPAPTISITQGEDVVIEVYNGLDDETSIHFHGIEMHNTPWSDGTPGLSQRPIEPGGSFTYRWKATQSGAYWYHSHSHVQIEDGLFGALVIIPSADADRPFGMISQSKSAIKAMERAERDARPLLLTDYRHMMADEAWYYTQKARFDPACWDSILINGKGSVRCKSPAELDALLSPEQRRALSLVNGRMTDKGCYPRNLMALQWGGHGDPNAIPASMFEGCRPTEGPTEVIRVVRDADCNGESWIALHFIGALHSVTTMVSIDEHPMWVYALDGGYITPRRVEAAPVSNAERVSVLVKVDKPGKFNIRVAAITEPQIIIGLATLEVYAGKKARRSAGSSSFQSCDNHVSNHGATYSKERSSKRPRDGVGRAVQPRPTAYINDAGKPLSRAVTVLDPIKTKPYPPIRMPRVADDTHVLHMGNVEPPYLWAMNFTSLAPSILDKLHPLLFEPTILPNHTVVTKNNTWVDLVLITYTSPNPVHPIHKHGVKMHLLGTGLGEWTWDSVEEAAQDNPGAFNLVDPPLKDVFLSLRLEPWESEAWMVVRYHSRNPGPWLLHCHVQEHLLGGMQAVILDGMEVWPKAPVEYWLAAEAVA